MGIKKIARPINKAKNAFVKWLKDNKAEGFDIYGGDDKEEEDRQGWDYYRSVSAFVGESLYTVYFEMWRGEVKISYKDEGNRYDNMSINEFMLLIE